MGVLIIKILVFAGVFYTYWQWLLYLHEFLNAVYPIKDWLFWVVFLVFPLLKIVGDALEDD